MLRLTSKKILLPLVVLFFLFVLPCSVHAIDWDYSNSGTLLPDSNFVITDNTLVLDTSYFQNVSSGFLQYSFDSAIIDPVLYPFYLDSVEPVGFGNSFSLNFSVRGVWGLYLSTATHYFTIQNDVNNINYSIRDEEDPITTFFTLDTIPHFVDNFHDVVVSYTSPDFSIYIDDVLIGITTGSAVDTVDFITFLVPAGNYPQTLEFDYINISYDEPYDPTYIAPTDPPVAPARTDSEVLVDIDENLTKIKAFCYALGVALALLLVLFTVNKLVSSTIGQVF